MFYKQQKGGLDYFMQTGSETGDGKSDSSGGGVDPQKEAAYWREQHSKQPYAKGGSFEQFEHAYKTGHNSFFKYPGQNFADVEDDVALGYEEAKPGAARCHGTRCVPR
jgi:hypothetical protein